MNNQSSNCQKCLDWLMRGLAILLIISPFIAGAQTFTQRLADDTRMRLNTLEDHIKTVEGEDGIRGIRLQLEELKKEMNLQGRAILVVQTTVGSNTLWNQGAIVGFGGMLLKTFWGSRRRNKQKEESDEG